MPSAFLKRKNSLRDLRAQQAYLNKHETAKDDFNLSLSSHDSKTLSSTKSVAKLVSEWFALYSNNLPLSLSLNPFLLQTTPHSIVFPLLLRAVGENPAANTHAPLTRIKVLQTFKMHSQTAVVTGNPARLSGSQLHYPIAQSSNRSKSMASNTCVLF